MIADSARATRPGEQHRAAGDALPRQTVVPRFSAATLPLAQPPALRAGRFRPHRSALAPTAKGMHRPALLERFVAGCSAGSVIVTGPPGAGKSELTAQFAEVIRDRGHTVAWCRVEESIPAPLDLLELIGEALLGRTANRNETLSVHRLAQAARVGTTPDVLVIDNAHHLRGNLAGVIRLVIEALASRVRFVFVGRGENPEWSVPLRLAGPVLVLDAHDLRFGPQDVMRLFADHYHLPLPWEAARELTERTAGWIAPVHLFHMATADLTPADRIARISTATSTVLVRQYLVANVLAGLSREAVALLRFGSLMPSVVPHWCDALLARVDSGRVLDQLADQNLLVERDTGNGHPLYRYHPVLREYLLGQLRAEIGLDALREFSGKLARLYESAGCAHEAFVAFLRASDVRATCRLLGVLSAAQDGSIAVDRGAVLLAEARGAAINDRLDAAMTAYRAAAECLPAPDLLASCLREQDLVTAWSQPAPPAEFGMPHWSHQLRHALACRPESLAEHPLAESDDGWLLASGIAATLAGRSDDAVSRWTRMSPGHGVVGLVGAGLRAIAASWNSADELAASLESLAEQAERDHLDGLASLLRAARATSGLLEYVEDAERIERDCHAGGRLWIALGAGVAASIGRCRSGAAPMAALRRCERLAAQLGAGSVRSWAAATQADRTRADEDDEPRRGAARVAARVSLPDATVVIRCFGGFDVVGAEPVAWAAMRPRVRSVLGLLALRAGSGVPVETLHEAFWPGATLESARRSLHVAVSMIRRALAAVVPEGSSVLRRRGESYVLLPPPATADVDVLRFQSAVRRWRLSRQNGEPGAEHLREAFGLYSGDLLPEFGAAEWILADRSRYRAMVLDVAAALATTELKQGNPATAAEVCATAIDIDRFHDPTWRLLIRAHLAARDVGAAEHARRRYREMLSELGVTEYGPPALGPGGR